MHQKWFIGSDHTDVKSKNQPPLTHWLTLESFAHHTCELWHRLQVYRVEYFVIKKPSSVWILGSTWAVRYIYNADVNSKKQWNTISHENKKRKEIASWWLVEERSKKGLMKLVRKMTLCSMFLSHIQSLLLMKPCTTFCSDHLINKQTWIAKQRHFSSGSYQKLYFLSTWLHDNQHHTWH